MHLVFMKVEGRRQTLNFLSEFVIYFRIVFKRLLLFCFLWDIMRDMLAYAAGKK